MDNYKLQQIIPSESENCCATCVHAFIPLDFLLAESMPEIYCNINKDRTISGDVLSEPFNYYDEQQLSAQENAWADWSKTHRVEFAGICDKFKKVKE